MIKRETMVSTALGIAGIASLASLRLVGLGSATRVVPIPVSRPIGEGREDPHAASCPVRLGGRLEAGKTFGTRSGY